MLLLNAKTETRVRVTYVTNAIEQTFRRQLVDFVVGEVDIPQVNGVDQHTAGQFGHAIVGDINVLEMLPTGDDLLFDV